MSFLDLIAPTSKDSEEDKKMKLEWVGFSNPTPKVEKTFEEEKSRLLQIRVENTPTLIKRPYSDHGYKLSFDGKRRKFSTKDCEECTICSDEVFEVNHPHISTVKQLQEKLPAQVPTSVAMRIPIWCQICQKKHRDPKIDPNVGRLKVVLGSSTLAHLWKTEGYQNGFHIDFDCIIGGQIHDIHLSYNRQYRDVAKPMDIILACGMNNIPSGRDSSKNIVLQLKSLLKSIKRHTKNHDLNTENRVVICPLLFAPKFCSNRLPPAENHLSKIIGVNKWIKKYNRKNTGLQINMDKKGVQEVPNGVNDPIEHVYEDWNEPEWTRMLHLSTEAKSSIATEVITVFEKLDNTTPTLALHKM